MSTDYNIILNRIQDQEDAGNGNNFIRERNGLLYKDPSLDPTIRFAGKIVEDKLMSSARKEGVIPLLDKELAALAHHQVSVKAMMDKMFVDKLGQTDWIMNLKVRSNC